MILYNVFNLPFTLRVGLTAKVYLKSPVFGVPAERISHNQIPFVLINKKQGVLIIYKHFCEAAKILYSFFVGNDNLPGGKGSF
jgi:hypothetical protein